MKIRGASHCAVLSMAMMSAACGTHVAEKPPAHLEATLGALAGAPALLRPEDLASALHIAISKPQLATGDGYQSESLGLIYRMGANPWGVTRMDFAVTTDKSGVYAAYEELALTLDKSYCLKPANFSATVGLKLTKVPMQMSDIAGTYDEIFYESPVSRGTVLRVESASEEYCAKRVALSVSYPARQVGPTVMTMIPREIDNRFPAYAPFTAEEFWQNLLAMIRLHSGYIGPEELEQSLHVTFTPITIGYKSIAHRQLRARDSWYLGLSYEVTGPGYQSVQPGVIPDGKGSALDIQIPSFSFVDRSGREECLAVIRRTWIEVSGAA